MHPVVRVIVGVITGVVASFVIVALVEVACIMMFPLPPGTSMRDPVAMKAAMMHVPMTAKVMVLAGWLLGALVGTFLTARIARSAAQGVIVGVVLLTMAVINLREFPHPLWMWVGAIVGYVVATALGARFGAPRGVASAAPARV